MDRKSLGNSFGSTDGSLADGGCKRPQIPDLDFSLATVPNPSKSRVCYTDVRVFGTFGQTHVWVEAGLTAMDVSRMQPMDRLMFPKRKPSTTIGWKMLSVAWVGSILASVMLHGQEPKPEPSMLLRIRPQPVRASHLKGLPPKKSTNGSRTYRATSMKNASRRLSGWRPWDRSFAKLKGRIETESDIEARTRLIGLIAQIEAIQNEKTIDAF